MIIKKRFLILFCTFLLFGALTLGDGDLGEADTDTKVPVIATNPEYNVVQVADKTANNKELRTRTRHKNKIKDTQ